MSATGDEREGYRALGRRVLRPERARLVEARGAIEGVIDPRAAWETLSARGLVPEGELYAKHRAFRRAEGPWAPCPPTPYDAALVASDSAAMRTAEELAREFLEAARPLGVTAPERFLWEVDREPFDDARQPVGHAVVHAFAKSVEVLMRHYTPPEYLRVYEPVWGVMEGSELPEEKGRPGDDGLPFPFWYSRFAYEQACLERLWSHAAEAKKKLRPSSKSPLAHLRGVSFAEQRNPFTPLLAVWRTGYAVDEVCDEGVVLVCPSVWELRGRSGS